MSASGGNWIRHRAAALSRVGPTGKGRKMVSLFWLIFVVLLVLWLVGFAVNWGAFIWLLLVAAAIVLVVNLLTGSRTGRWY